MTAVAPAIEPWPALLEAASAPYRRSGHFAWHFARGKLGFDPLFRHLASQGLIAPHARVLDIGCGRGLLASLLRACTASAQQGRWPAQWAPAPAATRVTGIELRARDVECARASLGNAAEFVCGDMRHTPFPEADTVVLFDVLHYISLAEQDEVLARVRQALPVGGQLLLRVGDAAVASKFLFSRGVDTLVSWLRGNRSRLPRSGRSVAAWTAQLESLGFAVRSEGMSQGTPFANVLLVATVRRDA